MIKTYLALFGAICILLIGNSPSVISPFIVGSFEDYFNLSKQSVGNLMSLELGLMAISSIFFSTFKINYKLSRLIILGVSIVLISYLLTSFAINTTQPFLFPLMENRGFEPLTSAVRSQRSTN